MKHFPDEIFHYDVAISDGKSDDDFPKNLNLSIIEELVRLNRSTFKKSLCMIERRVYIVGMNFLSSQRYVSTLLICINVHMILKIRKKERTQKNMGTINQDSSCYFICIQCCIH